MSIALSVEGISKQYRIYDRPGDRLKETLSRGRWKCHREFWALSDINFEIEAGTTAGIIGPNGSGKSTLLQIITGTLEPTHGRVLSDGRIAALLELGAGFDMEFTGIENVFMNASLLGFSRRQTEALLPEIERFAEIGSFIHQPVKTYSSGMYVRLAFSIAVSTAPQILIIDEALAVGDAVFQHRCTRRIKEMQESGVTILFVSHDLQSTLPAILDHRAILFHAARLEALFFKHFEPFAAPAAEIENVGRDACILEHGHINFTAIFDVLTAAAKLVFKRGVEHIEHVRSLIRHCLQLLLCEWLRQTPACFFEQ